MKQYINIKRLLEMFPPIYKIFLQFYSLFDTFLMKFFDYMKILLNYYLQYLTRHLFLLKYITYVHGLIEIDFITVCPLKQ